MKRTQADVIVIGSGIVGCSAAYYLTKQGLSVICLEKSSQIGDGSSTRNGGGARQSGRDEREIELAIYATRHIWPTLKDELGIDPEWRQNGYLCCGYNEDHKKSLEQRIRVAARYGIEMEMMEGDEIKRRNPYVSDHVTVATWTPQDAVVNPLLATLGYYRRARQLGAVFYTGVEVTALGTRRGRIREVIAADGTVYEADAVILAAGYFSRKIYNTVGLDVPVFKRLIEIFITEAMPPMFHEMVGGMSGFYGHQTEHGSFIFGNSTGREMCFSELPFGDELVSTSYNVCNIARTIGVDFPALAQAKIIRHWSGWHDTTPDGVPIVGAADAIPGLYLSFGACGHGFCPGPAIGYILAGMSQGTPSPVDLSGLRYDRFDYASNIAAGNIDRQPTGVK